MAGLLHDGLEDTTTTEDEITKLCGLKVTNLVKGVTKTKENREIIELLETVSDEDSRVILVKLADRYDNICDGLLQMEKRYQIKYYDETPKLLDFAIKHNITILIKEIRIELIKIKQMIS